MYGVLYFVSGSRLEALLLRAIVLLRPAVAFETYCWVHLCQFVLLRSACRSVCLVWKQGRAQASKKARLLSRLLVG